MKRPIRMLVGMLATSALLATVLAATAADAQRRDDAERHRGRTVYQRHAFDRPAHKDPHHHHRRRGREPIFVPQPVSPPVSSGWFQRPYPYHLDYYRMRYGGSYAPYFGNLYGPPQIVTAPPFFGPYFGDFGAGDAGMYGSQPGFPYPAEVPNGEGLPAP